MERSFLMMENDFYFEALRERNVYSLKEAKKYKGKIAKEYNKTYKKEFDSENSLYIPLTESE